MSSVSDSFDIGKTYITKEHVNVCLPDENGDCVFANQVTLEPGTLLVFDGGYNVETYCFLTLDGSKYYLHSDDMEKLKEADDEVESGVLLSDEDMQVITKILEAGKKIISLVNEGKKKLNQSKIEDGKLFVKDKSTNGFVVISSDRIYPVDEDMKPTAGSAEIFSLLAFLESWIDS